MPRSIVITALLCSIVHLGSGIPANEPISSRIIKTHLPNPVAVVMDSTLYTISKTKRNLSINSSEATCNLATDPFDENIQARIKATPLKGARKIVVWGIQSSNLEGAVRSIYYTLLIVDPLDCTYKAVTLPEDRRPTSWQQMLPQLVAYDEIFYVFYPTHQRCAPCSFDSEGNQKGMSNRQMQQQSGVPSKQFWIKEYYSQIYKYLFHAYNFDNGTALIELVDDYWFRSVSRVYVNHPVDAASVAFGTYQNTAICYTSGSSRQEVRCERLNKRLVPGMSWNLPTSNHPVTDIFIEVDSLGNTFIGTISFHETRFYVYDVDGDKVVEWVGVNGENYPHQEVNGIRFGDEYCVDAIMYSDRGAQETQEVVKCFDVKEYTSIN